MLRLDNYLFFVENSKESKEQFIALLQDEEVYRFLLEWGYIKPINIYLSFQFVGTISVKDFVICVFPKYYYDIDLSKIDIIREFVQVIKILKKAGVTEPSIPDYSNIASNESVNLSELLIADKLIKDYLEFGILVKSNSQTTLDGEGEPNWNTTIENLSPIFVKNGPIYINSYNSSVLTDEYNVITEFHKWLLKHLLRKYGDILAYSITYPEDSVTNLSDLGSVEYLSSVLRKELNEKYVDRDIVLIKRMLSFLQGSTGAKFGNFTLFGTGYFHIIWEKACSVFFQNSLAEYKKYIPPPIWHNTINDHQSKESFLPDIIKLDQTNSTLFILDAKYYNLKYKTYPFSVNNNPGIGDVSKQFLYYKIFESFPCKRKVNCFLFPTLENLSYEIIGWVTLQLFDDSRIFNLHLSATVVFNHYLHNKAVDSGFLNLLIADLGKFEN